jgi:hypothetical protein
MVAYQMHWGKKTKFLVERIKFLIVYSLKFIEDLRKQELCILHTGAA